MMFKNQKNMVPNLNIIRDHIDSHLNNETSIKPGLIAHQLSSMTVDSTVFTVKVLKIDRKKKPFIMCVYPDVEELDKLSHPMIDALNKNDTDKVLGIWSGVKKWHIEIDSRLITRGNPICVDNGSEFVAILCHELGHIMDEHPVHLCYNYQMNRARINTYEKMLSSKFSVAKLFLPMFVCIDGLRIVVSKPVNQLKEISADSHIPTEYKPYMVSYVENHILTNPDTATGIVVTDEEFDKEQSKGVMFTAECIRLMRTRRNVVATQLDIQNKLTSTGYFKEICSKVAKSISGKKPTGEPDYVREMYINKTLDSDIESAISEAAKFEAVIEAKDITDRDIMILVADADSMESTSDKSYIINTIFDYMERLQKKRNKILSKSKETDPTKLNKLTQSEDEKIMRLNNLLKTVMDTRVNYYGAHYGVFVKYPEGYEG